jgi:hypothetical protein
MQRKWRHGNQKRRHEIEDEKQDKTKEPKIKKRRLRRKKSKGGTK